MLHFVPLQEEFTGVDERLHNLLTAYNNIVSFDVRHDLEFGRAGVFRLVLWTPDQVYWVQLQARVMCCVLGQGFELS